MSRSYSMNSVFLIYFELASISNKTKLFSEPASPVHIFNVWTINMQSSNIQEWHLFKLQTKHKLHNIIYNRWCAKFE